MTYNIGIVVSDFNQDITTHMQRIAQEHIHLLGSKVIKVINVPGAFDTPLAIKKLLEKETIQGVVTLGAVIEGGTDHDSIVANNAARKIADLSLQYSKPVTLGIIGPKVTRNDAVKRLEKYSKSAVESLIKLLRAYDDAM